MHIIYDQWLVAYSGALSLDGWHIQHSGWKLKIIQKYRLRNHLRIGTYWVRKPAFAQHTVIAHREGSLADDVHWMIGKVNWPMRTLSKGAHHTVGWQPGTSRTLKLCTHQMWCERTQLELNIGHPESKLSLPPLPCIGSHHHIIAKMDTDQAYCKSFGQRRWIPCMIPCK